MVGVTASLAHSDRQDSGEVLRHHGRLDDVSEVQHLFYFIFADFTHTHTEKNEKFKVTNFLNEELSEKRKYFPPTIDYRLLPLRWKSDARLNSLSAGCERVKYFLVQSVLDTVC